MTNFVSQPALDNLNGQMSNQYPDKFVMVATYVGPDGSLCEFALSQHQDAQEVVRELVEAKIFMTASNLQYWYYYLITELP